MSNVIDFPRKPQLPPTDEPLCRPMVCQIDSSVRVADFARALDAGGFSIVHNRTSDVLLIKPTPQAQP